MEQITMNDLNLQTTQSIADWFTTAKPVVSNKAVNTQLGVHFEEVGEMLEAIGTNEDIHLEVLIAQAQQAMTDLATALKESDTVLTVDRVLLVDALADQVVTAIGSGTFMQMDMAGAIDEVNRSNWSKFDSDGKAILDANGKIMKSPRYFKAELAQFV